MDLLTKKQPTFAPGQRVIWKISMDALLGTSVPLMGTLNKISGREAEVVLTGDFLDTLTGKLYPKGFVARPLIDQLKLAD